MAKKDDKKKEVETDVSKFLNNVYFCSETKGMG